MPWTSEELERMRNVRIGWDSPESFAAAMARGETAAPEYDEYVEPAQDVINPYLATADKGTSLSNTLFGTIQTATPGVMLNALSGGVWSGFDVNDMAGGLAVIKAYSLSVYGSTELGTVRYSSEVLENEPTGVRPGSMERIVIPAWARRERGSPL